MAQQMLSEALFNFKCKKDSDIETFLNNKAVDFEKRGLCTVYLLLNENDFENKKIQIEAYFNLSHKTIHLNEDVSGNMRKEVAIFKDVTDVHFVLIGQLGKYIDE